MSPLRSLHTLCLLIVGGLLLSFPLRMQAQYRLPLAPRARNIGLRLGKYALPEGGALFVKAKGSTARGALTSQNNSPDSLLQIAPIDAEALILEYEYPQGASPVALGLPFRIEAVFYGFRDFRDAREADFAQPGEPFYNHPRASLASLACAPNVLAYPEAWRQSRSTLLLVVGGQHRSLDQQRYL